MEQEQLIKRGRRKHEAPMADKRTTAATATLPLHHSSQQINDVSERGIVIIVNCDAMYLLICTCARAKITASFVLLSSSSPSSSLILPILISQQHLSLSQHFADRPSAPFISPKATMVPKHSRGNK
jgi:hypothetical protein